MNPDPSAPTPERKRRSAFLVGPAVGTEHGPARAGTRVHRSLTTLERLVKNGVLEVRQAQAGERLRADYELGVVGAREAASGSASTVGWYYSEARLAALRSFELAQAAIAPMANYVVPIAIDELSVSELARNLRQNRQQVAGILKLGLSTLANHYGIDCDRTKISHNMLTSRNSRLKHSANRP